MTIRLGAAAAAACALSACATAQPLPVHTVTPGHECDSSNLQQFVGHEATAELSAEMMRVSGAATIRWVPQGTAVTMEFRSDRLTVFLDSGSRVERLSCS